MVDIIFLAIAAAFIIARLYSIFGTEAEEKKVHIVVKPLNKEAEKHLEEMSEQQLAEECQLLIKRCSRKWGDNGKARQVDLGIHTQLCRPVKNILSILITSKCKTAHDQDPMIMQFIHQPFVIVDFIHGFVDLFLRLLIDGFKPDQKALASALLKNREQLITVSDRSCRQTKPPFFQRDHRRKKFFCVIDIRDQIDVRDNDDLPLECFYLIDDILHRTGQDMSPKGGRISAERTGVVTAPDTLHGI